MDIFNNLEFCYGNGRGRGEEGGNRREGEVKNLVGK